MRPIDFRFLIVWNNKAIPVIKERIPQRRKYSHSRFFLVRHYYHAKYKYRPDEEQTYASYAIPYSSDSWRIFRSVVRLG